MRIVLCCTSGMSTSLLVSKMINCVEGKNIEIEAVSVDLIIDASKTADVMLLGPQISYKEKEFKELVSVPLTSIPMVVYGMMDAQKVLQIAKELISDHPDWN